MSHCKYFCVIKNINNNFKKFTIIILLLDVKIVVKLFLPFKTKLFKNVLPMNLNLVLNTLGVTTLLSHPKVQQKRGIL